MTTLLYSIYPPEVVLAAQEQKHDQMPVELVAAVTSVDGQRRYAEIKWGDVYLIVCKIGPGRAKIVRLISTDPDDYLDPRFTPGSEIEIF